jgi:hypothetical protein
MSWGDDLRKQVEAAFRAAQHRSGEPETWDDEPGVPPRLGQPCVATCVMLAIVVRAGTGLHGRARHVVRRTTSQPTGMDNERIGGRGWG